MYHFKTAILLTIITIVFIIGCSLHMFKITHENINEIDISEDITVISGGIGIILMILFFSRGHVNWSALLRLILDFRAYGKPRGIENLIKSLNFYSKLYSLYYCGGTVVYAGTALMEAPHCNEINLKRDLHLTCDTYIPIWIPFDLSYYTRISIFITQFLLINIIVCPSAMICFLVFEITEIIALHLDHLKVHFKKMIDFEDAESRRIMIGSWVRYHNHIFRMSIQLRQLAKSSVGYITLVSAIVFGCTENQVMKAKPLGALVFFFGWMVALFLICHAGQKLMHESVALSDALFSSNWYQADTKTIKDMIIILLRAQKPIFLEALPLGNANYALFVMIIQTSYSYLTLLNQTT